MLGGLFLRGGLGRAEGYHQGLGLRQERRILGTTREPDQASQSSVRRFAGFTAGGPAKLTAVLDQHDDLEELP